ncbi:MAG: hypothetical protein ACMG6E_07395 [Candidatus Roizmanbacteria bacterium]
MDKLNYLSNSQSLSSSLVEILSAVISEWNSLKTWRTFAYFPPTNCICLAGESDDD